MSRQPQFFQPLGSTAAQASIGTLRFDVLSQFIHLIICQMRGCKTDAHTGHKKPADAQRLFRTIDFQDH